jgi:hypothetical protein
MGYGAWRVVITAIDLGIVVGVPVLVAVVADRLRFRR